MNTRKERLLPAGVPRYIRCYDNNGETADRYTVVFTGNYKGRDYQCDYIGMGGNPFHPQGVCMHGTEPDAIDRPKYSHLGKKIKFLDLPKDCQQVVLDDYKEMWNL